MFDRLNCGIEITRVSYKYKIHIECYHFIGILQKADLAIADITITRQREHDVDFTSPFMNLGKLLS